jgi:2-polyprenyl-3-methyl-5-hydroxy-6-metoxy-1,4-benzoquinol methylase
VANARGKTIDSTHLSLDQATERGFIHRDYLAHCLRWSHVARYLRGEHRYQTQHVLDVGCGREVPLAKLLFSDRMTHTTGSYTGVDVNKLERPKSITVETKRFNLTLLGKADFTTVKLARKSYDTIVSFEVLEHVEPEMTFHILQRIRQLLAKDGRAFISTPCFDPRMGAADNHVNEMSYLGLEYLIHLAGFKVVENYGTFASQRDYKHLLTAAEKDVFLRLQAYYDSNVLACLFAPLYPAHSRNCLWVLTPKALPKAEKIPADLLKPEHSSSDQWVPHLKRILKELK